MTGAIMDGAFSLIAEEAGRLAKLLPFYVVRAVAALLVKGGDSDWGALRVQIAQVIPSPHYRGLAVAFLDRWRSEASGVLPQSVATALLTAALAERDHRERQSVELVWTGPDVGVVPLRRTEQVVLQVIDSATERLLVVSYAVFHIPRIVDALVRAADRGVSTRVVIESPDRITGENAYNTLAALGSTVASRCAVFLWPIEERLRDGAGRPGILHDKCAVADGRWLFLSSANLTEYAFSINMELGVLITGERVATQVQSHFERMIETGILVKV
jgi:phosphatidylserine/phosphatidylglycerophosphate/cardiolipin synthase-like enzyme